MLATMIPYYIYIPVSDNGKGANLTGPEAVGLIIFCVWLIAVAVVAEFLVFDIDDRLFDDTKQDIKRHAIELIVLIAVGVIALAAIDMR